MEIYDIDNWPLFTIVLGLLLVVTLVMMKQSQHFYTKDVVIRKFSIIELQVPATATELYNIIKGLYALPAPQSQKAISALKRQLQLDFLFMPLVYGAVFLLCWRVSAKMHPHFGYYLFLVLAILQVIPWICDIAENIFLLGKLKSDIEKPTETPGAKLKHKRYLFMEAIKWGVLLTGAVCALSAIAYFWLTGNYSGNSLVFLLIVFAEILLFLLGVKLISPKK